MLSPQAEFLLGKRYYSDDSFGLAAEHFEVAVDEYFTAYKECRALCEGSYNYDGYNYMEYSADLFQTMTGEAAHPNICTKVENSLTVFLRVNVFVCVRPLHAGAEL